MPGSIVPVLGLVALLKSLKDRCPHCGERKGTHDPFCRSNPKNDETPTKVGWEGDPDDY